MLKQLKLKNFRQHRELTVDFTPGLNVVRGRNEAGKSTLLEAIAYALLGVSACRTSLADMVTWGEKESSLKTELTFSVEGIEYTITRGKSGAELNWSGGKVVGQKDVAAKVGTLLGIDTKNVNRLILSGQGNIRGALDEGSTKTAELIEQLANFSIVDEVIELIGAQLVTGPTKPFEEKAAALTAELATLEAALVPPDTAADETRLAELEQTVEVVQDEANSIMDAIGPKAARRDQLRAKATERARLQERVKVLEEQCAAASKDFAAHQAVEPTLPPPGRAQDLQRQLDNIEQLRQRMAGKAVVERTHYPEDNFWEGDLASFEAELSRNDHALREARGVLTAALADIRVKKAEIVAAAKCGHCGQDFSQLPAAKAKNEQLAQDLAELEKEVVGVRASIAEEEATQRALQAVQREHQRIQTALARYGADVSWDTSVVPHRPRWAFVPADGGPLNANTLAAQLANAQSEERAYRAWATRLEVLREAFQRADAARDKAKADLAAGFPGLDELPALEDECERLNQTYSSLYTSLVQTQAEAAEIMARVSSAKTAYAAAAARVEQARAAKADAEKMIDEVGFNNALLKRVREARPIIANKLWSMVLTAVSRYFSQMRNTESVVTKDGDGFKVDGKAIEALSGSTLDILGLAIRTALVRTFLPHTPLMVLDEPSAACDAERTESMMGFLLSCGFDQLLLVTHESMSENVAENLIVI